MRTLVLVRRDKEQNAVVLVLFAEFPVAKQGVGVRFDLVAVERSNRRDNELDAGFLFEIGELRLQRRFRRRRNDIGRIDDAPGQRREIIGERQARRAEQGGEEKQESAGAARESRRGAWRPAPRGIGRNGQEFTRQNFTF